MNQGPAGPPGPDGVSSIRDDDGTMRRVRVRVQVEPRRNPDTPRSVIWTIRKLL